MKNNLPPWIMSADGRMVYTPSGDHPWEPQLTPGANLAKRKGCTCSRLDNHWGEGREIISVKSKPIEIPRDFRPGELSPEPEIEFERDVEFFITPGCPLHDVREGNEDKRGHTEPVRE